MDASAERKKAEIPVVRARQADEPRVLSIGQQRLWYLSQLSPNNPAYNVPYASRISGPLNIAALEKSVHEVVGRHEVLRTIVLAPGGNPVPVLLKKWSPQFKRVDLRNLPADQKEAEATRVLHDESSIPFNFARDLMLRCTLVQLDDDEFIFLHVSPHMAFEGGSVAVFFRDLARFYEAILDSKSPELPEMALQYCDYALWQRKHLQGDRLDSLNAYWKETLAGAPLINLPLDHPRPAIHTMRGTRHFWSMPAQLLSDAHRFFRESGTTPYRGLGAAFNAFLYSYTGQTDFSLGSPFAPRCTGIEDLVGFFVNTVVLRTRFESTLSFRDLMKRVDQVVRGAIEHSDLTFDKLVEAAHIPRDSSRSPLFQVNFRAPKEPYPAIQLRGLSADRAQYVDNGTAKFDLAMELESSQGEACYFEYCIDLFQKETIEQMVRDFQKLLSGLIAQPDKALEELPEVKEIKGKVRR